MSDVVDQEKNSDDKKWSCAKPERTDRHQRAEWQPARPHQPVAHTPKRAAERKTMVGSGVDGSTFPHGTQALEFESLVKRAGMSPARAIQAGTIVNAEAMGWQDQIGSIAKGKFALTAVLREDE